MTFGEKHRKSCLRVLAFSLACPALAALTHLSAAVAQTAPAISIGSDAIGGRVMRDGKPEAGVWVIAETSDLPTKFAKIVVTDEMGRFVIPQLPSANYKIWVRGYDLVDSEKQDARPGELIDLTAKLAPSRAAAAEYYPGMYWYSLIKIPAASEFPGSDDSPTGVASGMRTQEDWLDTVKNTCHACHGQ
jgi:hypothetical protein